MDSNHSVTLLREGQCNDSQVVPQLQEQGPGGSQSQNKSCQTRCGPLVHTHFVKVDKQQRLGWLSVVVDVSVAAITLVVDSKAERKEEGKSQDEVEDEQVLCTPGRKAPPCHYSWGPRARSFPLQPCSTPHPP